MFTGKALALEENESFEMQNRCKGGTDKRAQPFRLDRFGYTCPSFSMGELG